MNNHGEKMKARQPRTAHDVRDDFRRRGTTVTQWARDHGFPVSTVLQVINGRNAGSYGKGHKIAVLLGIKDGVITADGDDTHAA